jgi:hypothetical protein
MQAGGRNTFKLEPEAVAAKLVHAVESRRPEGWHRNIAPLQRSSRIERHTRLWHSWRCHLAALARCHTLARASSLFAVRLVNVHRLFVQENSSFLLHCKTFLPALH